MWMPEYGLAHNVYMGFGYLIALASFGSLFYVAVRYLLRNGDSGN